MPLTFDLVLPPHLDAAMADGLVQTLSTLDSSRAAVLVVRQETPFEVSPTDRAEVEGGGEGGGEMVAAAGAVRPRAEGSDSLEAYARLGAALRRCLLPTLAVAEARVSEAVAGSFAACDIVLATRDAWFEAPRGERGIPQWGVLAALRRRVGATDLRAWATAGKLLGAHRAASLRLVDERIIGAAITARTASWARALATSPDDSRAYLRERFDPAPPRQAPSPSARIAWLIRATPSTEGPKRSVNVAAAKPSGLDASDLLSDRARS